MSFLFGLGLVGCFFVIPIVAFRLFAVFFEEDSADELQNKAPEGGLGASESPSA